MAGAADTSAKRLKVLPGAVKLLRVDWSRNCRICLAPKRPMTNLFNYQSPYNYVEMLTCIANVQVSSDDGFPKKICNKCTGFLEKAIKFKKLAESSDRKFHSYSRKQTVAAPSKKIAFDSFKDIKDEMETLSIKKEPNIQVEIEVLSSNMQVDNSIDGLKGKDIVIGNTVIRTMDGSEASDNKDLLVESKADVTWKSIAKSEPKYDDDDGEIEYLDDDFIGGNNDSDEDYIPLSETVKQKKSKDKTPKFKKPKLSNVKVLKVLKENKKNVVNKPKNLVPVKYLKLPKTSSQVKGGQSGGNNTYITCYPLMSNGAKGPPVLLKRPKDATILRIDPNYKPRIGYVRNNRPTKGKQVSARTAIVKQREKHVCPVCGILTFGLGNHMATHAEKKRYSCTECNKSFAQKSNLLSHMKSHSGVKDHICEVCGAGFYADKSLLRHKLIHKGERPFGCNLCTKRFIARCDLTRHLKIHSGYKPFKCNTCTMSFNAKHQLQNHERMHTGEKPYQCQRSHLTRHMRIHSGDKPYRCDICSMSFYASHHLKNHELMHTGDKPFSCEVCHVAFSYKVNLNNHVYKVHGINLKFKSIHIITEEVLQKEHDLLNEARTAIIQMAMPQISADQVPQPAAHETLTSSIEDIDVKGQW